LFFAKAGPQVDKRIRLVFPVLVVGALIFGEFGSCGGVEGVTRCGLEFDDEDFENFEGCGDDGV
jgi:hypothetical protein